MSNLIDFNFPLKTLSSNNAIEQVVRDLLNEIVDQVVISEGTSDTRMSANNATTSKLAISAEPGDSNYPKPTEVLTALGIEPNALTTQIDVGIRTNEHIKTSSPDHRGIGKEVESAETDKPEDSTSITLFNPKQDIVSETNPSADKEISAKANVESLRSKVDNFYHLLTVAGIVCF